MMDFVAKERKRENRFEKAIIFRIFYEIFGFSVFEIAK